MSYEFLQEDGELDMNALQSLLGSDTEVKNTKSLYQNTDMVRLIEKYTEVDLPEDLKKHPLVTELWAVLSKEIKWSFLEKEDEADFELLFDLAVINYLMQTPQYKFTFVDEQLLDQLRLYFVAAVKRARGVSGHRFNERIIEGGTINQVIRSNTDMIQAGGGGGGGLKSFMKRVF